MYCRDALGTTVRNSVICPSSTAVRISRMPFSINISSNLAKWYRTSLAATSTCSSHERDDFKTQRISFILIWFCDRCYQNTAFRTAPNQHSFIKTGKSGTPKVHLRLSAACHDDAQYWSRTLQVISLTSRLDRLFLLRFATIVTLCGQSGH